MSVDLSSLSSPGNSFQPKNGTSVEVLTETQLFHMATSTAAAAATSSTTSFVSDVPLPTVNGGYSHTTASKAKISAANKGKTPWNKGRQRSPEEKARIAAGVRAKNRERFLKKLEGLGVTEEEYEAQKKEERRKKAAERRARRTENGGYRPTEETKQKISKILKEKFAKGEIQRKKTDPSKVRRGFVHSEETRRKISESLKRRWADDEEYRESMKEKSTAANSRSEVRKQISDTLKQKWKDPEFRTQMLAKFSKRTVNQEMSHREKISKAMKKRWQDSEYRKKVVQSMAKRSEELAKLRPPVVPKTPRVRAKKKLVDRVVAASKVSISNDKIDNVVDDSGDDEHGGVDASLSTLKPVSPKPKSRRSAKPVKRSAPRKSVSRAKTPQRRKQSKRKAAPVKPTAADKVVDTDGGDIDSTSVQKSPKNEKGCVSRLREERRDLYDLLYGDDEGGSQSKLASVFELGDENLDSFDPYGLEDF